MINWYNQLNPNFTFPRRMNVPKKEGKMSSSRWISWFTLLAQCLSPLHGWDRARADRVIYPQVTTASVDMPAQNRAGLQVILASKPQCQVTPDHITLITKTQNGVQANNYSYLSAISADGRFVAYQPLANNLVINDTNGSGQWLDNKILPLRRRSLCNLPLRRQQPGGWGYK